ncbi:MAG: SRPBCC domain-containing protein [Bdellovibrionales bacterium]
MEKSTEQLDGRTDQKKNLKHLPIVIERVFQAPVEKLWKAWSTVGLLKQWWGPNGYSSPEAKMDFRVGGDYLFSMQGPDGKVTWSGGTYRSIIPNKKIVCTDHFADNDGTIISANSIGLPGDWPQELRVTVDFESLKPHQTKMTVTYEGVPEEAHDDCVEGWKQTIDKLQKLVESN